MNLHIAHHTACFLAIISTCIAGEDDYDCDWLGRPGRSRSIVTSSLFWSYINSAHQPASCLSYHTINQRIYKMSGFTAVSLNGKPLIQSMTTDLETVEGKWVFFSSLLFLSRTSFFPFPALFFIRVIGVLHISDERHILELILAYTSPRLVS